MPRHREQIRRIRSLGGCRGFDPAAVGGGREEDQPHECDRDDFEQAVGDAERIRPLARLEVEVILRDEHELQAHPECARDAPEQEVVAGEWRAEAQPAALAGVAVEIGVVMLVYLNQAIGRHMATAMDEGRSLTMADVQQAVIDGAVMRVRPIMMTVAAIFAGLLPIMLGGGTGSEVMRRIAAPMVGGMVSATILTLIVIPALFLLWRGMPVRQQQAD